MKKWTFPAGERGVQVTREHINVIELKFKGSDSIIDMLLEVDAMRRLYTNPKLILDTPYFPYARQDRKMNEGESHSLKVICDLINSQDFYEVRTVDPHSDVVEALVNNLRILPQYEAVIDTIPSDVLVAYDYFIAPDAGALKKIYNLAHLYQKPVICAQKTRSVTDGKITGTSISKEYYNSLSGKKALVVDDICDGGRTFTELRDILPDDCNVDLYITHGIFSKGKQIILDKFNKVFCYNDMTFNK